jgi:hypothetical protein
MAKRSFWLNDPVGEYSFVPRFVVLGSSRERSYYGLPISTREHMNVTGLIIQLISGAVGGNVAGAALKQYDLGTIGNSVAGIVGGGIGGQILMVLLGGSASGGGTDIGSIIGQIAGGGVGRGLVMIIVGIIRQAMKGGQSVKS